MSPEPSKKLLVLHLLREVGDRGITGTELLQAGCGSRYGGRIDDLRAVGHVIEAERVSNHLYRYRLTHDAGIGAGRGTGTTGPEGPRDTAGAAAACADPSPGADPLPAPGRARRPGNAPAIAASRPTPSPSLFDADGLNFRPGIYDVDEAA